MDKLVETKKDYVWSVWGERLFLGCKDLNSGLAVG